MKNLHAHSLAVCSATVRSAHVSMSQNVSVAAYAAAEKTLERVAECI